MQSAQKLWLSFGSQGADPIPSVADVKGPYRMKLFKWGSEILFVMNDLTIFHWVDDGKLWEAPYRRKDRISPDGPSYSGIRQS